MPADNKYMSGKKARAIIKKQHVGKVRFTYEGEYWSIQGLCILNDIPREGQIAGNWYEMARGKQLDIAMLDALWGVKTLENQP